MAIEWSYRARTDLRELKTYIARDSPLYARLFTERIITSVERLDAHPKIGRLVPEALGRDDVRELIYRGYRIIYRALPGRIVIVAIVHGSRNLAGKEKQPWVVG